MPNLFITQDIARGYFWEAIPKVCPEAFEHLASLVDSYLEYLAKTVDQRQVEELGDEDEGQSKTAVIDWEYEEEGTVFEWQKRWNLAGNEERGWVSFLAINNLACWAFDSDFLQRRGLVVIVPNAERPVFQLPELAIDQHEDWADFSDRAERLFKQTRAEYREALKDVGAFQQKIRRDARCLAAHQVAGQSWKEVARSLLADSEFVDEETVRKAGNRFAVSLPLTQRT